MKINILNVYKEKDILHLLVMLNGVKMILIYIQLEGKITLYCNGAVRIIDNILKLLKD